MPLQKTSGIVYCTVALNDALRLRIKHYGDDRLMNRAEAMRALIERGLEVEGHGGARAMAPSRSRSDPWAKA